MKAIFLSIIFLASYSFNYAQENTNTKNELKILSWNIYMLPAIANLSKSIKKSDKNKRAKEISDLMNDSDYDIIIFQEAFHIPSRQILIKKLKAEYPYMYGPINKGFFKTNSGIFVVSKIELKQLDKIEFTDCNSTDCLARKGCGVFEGEINGKKFQILGTHLNSTSKQEIRELQYEQIYKELLEAYKKEGVPQIICGDLNTSFDNKTAYNSMLKKMDAEDIETTSKQVNTTSRDSHVIDYVLMRKNNSTVIIQNKKIRVFKAKMKVIDKLHGTLSDHLAVEVALHF